MRTHESDIDVSRILVLAPNWLGDLVMALPALADVRRRWPQARLTVAARRTLAPLLTCVPGVDRAQTLTSDGSLLALLRSIRDDRARLSEESYDLALLLPNSFHAAWLARRAGVPNRWGYRTDLRGSLLTRAVDRPAGRIHQAQYYQHLTTSLGMPTGPLHPDLRPTEEAIDRGTRLLELHGWKGERLVGLAPGAAYGWAKRWPPERMGALAGRIARDLEARPVLVGAPADRGAVREVLRACEAARTQGEGPPPIDLVGATDLLTLAGVLPRCAAFVANDSGAMHLAAALGVPVTALFGPTREWATAPLPAPGAIAPRILKTDVWCRPCMLRNCPIDHRCMTGIPVEDALASVAAHLRARETELAVPSSSQASAGEPKPAQEPDRTKADPA